MKTVQIPELEEIQAIQARTVAALAKNKEEIAATGSYIDELMEAEGVGDATSPKPDKISTHQRWINTALSIAIAVMVGFVLGQLHRGL